MKKLILLLLIMCTCQQKTSAQVDSTLLIKYQKFKSLELKQMESERILHNSIRECIFLNKLTGRDVAHDYIIFAQDAIEKWKTVLETPDVLFIEMTTKEIVEMVKSHTQEDKDVEARIEELREKLREKIREHIQILSEDIRELAL